MGWKHGTDHAKNLRWELFQICTDNHPGWSNTLEMTNLSTSITNSSVEGKWLSVSGNSFQYIQQVDRGVLSLAQDTRRLEKALIPVETALQKTLRPTEVSVHDTKTFKGFQGRGNGYVLRSVCCSLALRSRSHMENGSPTRNFKF